MWDERSSRFSGALLGCAFGDILGAAVEGMSRQAIEQSFGEVRDFIDSERGRGRYTDDTQMTIALATSIVRCGGVDGADCARAYGEFFDPQRGYGRSAIRILEALCEGADYRKTGTSSLQGGSYGNGAAMRIAPVGLVYANCGAEVIRGKAFDAICSTHVHPEAIDGAVVQAMAVGKLSLVERSVVPDPKVFLELLIAACQDATMISSLKRVETLLQAGAGDDEAAEQLGTGVRSAEAVPAALWAALRYGSDPEVAIIHAVNLGGDTDTIGALCGALVGALHGDGWFPARWYNAMENGEWGRDALLGLARELARCAFGRE